MIVLHEELMEEVYDWLSDAEKQADSIRVNEDDIGSVMEEYGRHRVFMRFNSFCVLWCSLAFSNV